MLWQNAHSLIDPLINSHGFYSWSFNPLMPVDVSFYTLDKCVGLRANRHAYLELVHLGDRPPTFCLKQPAQIPINPGDLVQ
jgi:hypothetical protein